MSAHLERSNQVLSVKNELYAEFKLLDTDTQQCFAVLSPFLS
jgi:hypothetical protein